MKETEGVEGMGRLHAALSALREELPEAEIQMVMAFVVIAGEPGISMRELRERMGYVPSTNSRIVSALSSKGGRDGSNRAGADLVAILDNPNDGRSKLLQLTSKGRWLAEKIRTLMTWKA